MTKLSLLLKSLPQAKVFVVVAAKSKIRGSRLIVLWIAIVASTSVNSQELPQVTLPSPEAASLFKYMEYPVNFSTGLPQINIPLYEIKSGDLNLPISIGYHSSGRKVYDETGAIGLGWTLFAGGSISRVTYGEPDDNDYVTKFPSPWKTQADIDPQTLAGAEFLDGIVEEQFPIPWYDTEYDFFSYSVNSLNGKFVFRDENNVKVPVLIPKKPYKIEYHKTTVQSNINYFDYINIIDDKGILYRFGKSLRDGSEYYETSSGSTGKTSWMLTEIISADKVDTVYFKYQSFSKNRRTVSQKTIVTVEWTHCGVGGGNPDFATDDGLGTTSDVNYTVFRIKEIKFRNGTVKFNLASGSDLIESIHVINLKGDIVKAIDFGHTTQDLLSDGNPPTATLASLVMEDDNENSSEVYEFDYYPTVYPQSYSVVESKFRDLWGYYNASGQLGMRPVISGISVIHPVSGPQIISIGDPSASRNPSTSATQSGVLKKINFPTGGSEEFVYEQNKFWNILTAQVESCGGLRLQQRISDDGAGNTITKTYKYGVSESGYGTLPLIPNVNNMFYETRSQNYHVSESGCANTCAEIGQRTRIYNADVLPIFGEFHSRPVFYEEVTEYHGTLTDNIGKTIYKYDAGNQLGTPNSVQGLFASADYKYWKESSLIEKSDHKNIGGSYQLIRKTTNTYSETVYNDEKLWGLHVGRYYFITPHYLIHPVNGPNIPSYFPPGVVQGCGSVGADQVFRFSDYTISVGKKELESTTEVLYADDGSSTSTITEYDYNEDHLVSAISKHNSNNDVLLTEYAYPFDFPGESIYDEMVSRNMLSYEIEVRDIKNSSFLAGTKTTYMNWGDSNIKPEAISTKLGLSPYEPRIVFHSYDGRGNITCVSKDGGPKISYLWGYKREFPIARIDNAQLEQDVVIENAAPTAEGVQVPGIQPEYETVLTGINISFIQDITISCSVDRFGADPSIPDHYFNVTLSIFNVETQTELYNGFFGLTGLSSIVLEDIPEGRYILRYKYLGDIGVDNTFTFDATIDHQVEQIYGTAFHTSFEEDFDDVSTDYVTGKKSHIGSYAVNLPKVDGEYVLSYWTKQGSNAWQYVQENIIITPSSPATKTVGSSQKLLDEVRLYPKNARMTTYTYEPLVGITSSTDHNNIVTSYRYDDFGRLKLIRDHNQNILNLYQYHYRQQQ